MLVPLRAHRLPADHAGRVGHHAKQEIAISNFLSVCLIAHVHSDRVQLVGSLRIWIRERFPYIVKSPYLDLRAKNILTIYKSNRIFRRCYFKTRGKCHIILKTAHYFLSPL